MALGQGETIYQDTDGNYYRQSEQFPGTWEPFKPGTASRGLINAGLVTINKINSAADIDRTPSDKYSIASYQDTGVLPTQYQSASTTPAPTDTTTPPLDTTTATTPATVPAAPAPATSTTTPSATTIGGIDISTLPPELQQTLKGINDYLTKLQQNGQVVNPNIEITPEKLAEFTAQAQGEISPYYANTLALARRNLLTNAGYSANEVAQNEAKLAKQYNIQFQQIGSNAADQGFAQSGARVRDEGNLAQSTQDIVDTNRRQLAFDTTNAATNFASNFGSGNLPQLTIGNSPYYTGGEPTPKSGSGDRSLYTLDPSIMDALKTGTQQYQQTADVNNRVSQLTNAFNSNAALNQLRSLTL